MEYGVSVGNKFDMFLDECDDPLEILRRNEEEAKQKKLEKEKSAKNSKTANKKPVTTAKVTAKEPSKPAPKATVQTSSGTESKPTFEQARNQNADKPPRFGGRQAGGKPSEGSSTRQPPVTDLEGGNQRGGDNVARLNEFREQRLNEDGRGEGGRGRGGFRRGRGGPPREGREGGFDRFGKREFDRHSGSDKGGLKAVDKREGGGAHNWGTIKDDIEERMKAADDSLLGDKIEVEQSGDHPAAGAENEETGENGPDTTGEQVVEEKQMTLAEWKNLQEQSRVKASFNIRQAGEGYSGDPKWKKMYQLKKKDSDDEEGEEEQEDEEDDVHGKQKNIVPIAITFSDNPARRGGGAGRGGRGGRGGRDGSRGTNQGQKNQNVVAPNVNDETDFPSLA